MRYILCVILSVFMSAPSWADPALGTWLTGPDKKEQVAHVDVFTCQGGVCGKIVRAYDKAGNPAPSPNIGVLVFWDMKPVGGGKYEGRAFVPAHNRQYDGALELRGDWMKVSGCLGPVCQSQTWKRVR